MKRRLAVLLCGLLLFLPRLGLGGETVIEPAYPVPEYVEQLLSVAREELGYTEQARGYTKYGDWSGDPYAQWCAEFLCWCVDQTDQRYGTNLLKVKYPLYSGSNTGRDWFIREGRYVVRNGNLAGWGYQWFKGSGEYLKAYDYIPQPGDWVFFTFTSGTDTDHVAMVEYCARDENGKVWVHVVEGNNPDKVQRAVYPLETRLVLGYGTVHDVADVNMRSGNKGEKVRALQEKLCLLGYLEESKVDGVYGSGTVSAVKAFQGVMAEKKQTGIAELKTQAAIDAAVVKWEDDHQSYLVVDDPGDTDGL